MRIGHQWRSTFQEVPCRGSARTSRPLPSIGKLPLWSPPESPITPAGPHATESPTGMAGRKPLGIGVTHQLRLGLLCLLAGCLARRFDSFDPVPSNLRSCALTVGPVTPRHLCTRVACVYSIYPVRLLRAGGPDSLVRTLSWTPHHAGHRGRGNRQVGPGGGSPLAPCTR